jgi:hypothetical protein
MVVITYSAVAAPVSSANDRPLPGTDEGRGDSPRVGALLGVSGEKRFMRLRTVLWAGDENAARAN